MNAEHMTITLHTEPAHESTTVVDFIVNKVPSSDLLLVVRMLITSGIAAIERADLSEVRNALQHAYTRAEVSTIVRGRVQTSPTYSAPESDIERVNVYIAQREQAVRIIAEFQQMKGRLAAQYAGRYVAFYQGRVVDSDTDRAVLARRFYQEYGNVPVCIMKVSDQEETIRITTPFFHRG
jgi:hypothetical protein